jgi:hypothetical protein
MPFTDAYETALLDHVFSDPVLTPETLWLGLSSTTPTDAGGNITEPTGGAYARVQLTAAIMAAATGTAPASKANGSAVAFTAASADWVAGANLTHLVVFNASTAGACRAWGALTVAKPVLNGDTPSFPIGALAFRLGKGTAG